MRDALRSSSARSMAVPELKHLDGAGRDEPATPPVFKNPFRFSDETLTAQRASVDDNVSISGPYPVSPKTAQLQHCAG